MDQEFFFERYQRLGWLSPKPIKLRQVIRVNAHKISSDALVKRLEKRGVFLEKVPFLPNAYWIEAEFPISTTLEYLSGLFYVQEAAAQLPALVLDLDKEDLVLDMAAAPGGKALQMAELMQDEGVIVALDKDAKRMRALRNNVERLGFKNVLSRVSDSTVFTGEFDKILLDAPCSGNFVNDRNWFGKRDLGGVQRNAEKQKSLLAAAANLLKSGGLLMYSVCSLEPEECELVVDWAVNNLPLECIRFESPLGVPGLTKVFDKELHESVALARRVWPEQTQGFFMALLRKK